MNTSDDADAPEPGTVAAAQHINIDPSTVHGIFDAEFPDTTLVDWYAADEGTDFVAILTADSPGGRERLVLKVMDFLDPVSFRPEPTVLDTVDTQTDIPVPGVVAADVTDGDHPPYVVMEYVDGEQPADQSDLANEAIGRVARTAGRHLAQLHDMATWDDYGWLRHVDDVDAPGTVHHDLTPIDAHDSWPAFVTEGVRGAIDRFPDRFSDLESPLRDAAASVIATLPDQPTPVFCHGDYRLGNLLIDVDTGETRAAIDWGNHTVGHAVQDLVKTEDYLCTFAPRDSPRRELVRDAILDGYREIRAIEVDPDARDAYLLLSRLGPLAWFDLWYADADDPEEIATKHRDFVEQYV